jgi:dTDP-4-amino-4,6-dideoxygalactose transaminase
MTASHNRTPIHLFVPKYRVDECLAEIRLCLEKGWTGLGFKTIEFEEAFKAHTKLPHAHFVASATAGLHLAVRILKERENWKDGDEVITTPLTFVSTNHVLLHERLQPVFADVDEHLCLDPGSVASRITARTRAVMFVGFGGNPGRWKAILELCRSRRLRVILDAAHMMGSRVDGVQAGHGADATVFSFHAVKNLPTADGGMVCFPELEDDRSARKWSWLGISQDTYARTTGSAKKYRWRYDVDHVGFKYHGNSVMAALGLVALRYLEEDNQYRRRLCATYETLLAGCPGVSTIPVSVGSESSRHLFQILAANRDEMMTHLNENDIFPGVHYRDNSEYPMYSAQAAMCPRARHASERIVSLPLHLNLTEEILERVTTTIRRFCANRG